MNMIAVQDKAKTDIENIRCLNLVVAKRTTVQVTKLLLQNKVRKIGMICFANHELTEDLLLYFLSTLAQAVGVPFYDF
jgi:hypothetical protein